MPDCDVAHEKAALDAYVAAQFNLSYTAASKAYMGGVVNHYNSEGYTSNISGSYSSCFGGGCYK